MYKRFLPKTDSIVLKATVLVITILFIIDAGILFDTLVESLLIGVSNVE